MPAPKPNDYIFTGHGDVRDVPEVSGKPVVFAPFFFLMDQLAKRERKEIMSRRWFTTRVVESLSSPRLGAAERKGKYVKRLGLSYKSAKKGGKKKEG